MIAKDLFGKQTFQILNNSLCHVIIIITYRYSKKMATPTNEELLTFQLNAVSGLTIATISGFRGGNSLRNIIQELENNQK